MRKATALLLALCLLLPAVGALAAEVPAHRYEGDGFATPEEAVRAYLDGLRAGDLDAMLAAFAVETYVDHYDFEAQLERMRAYYFSMELRFPNENGFTRALNVESRKGNLLTYIVLQYLNFHLPELDVSVPLTFPPEDAGGIPALLAQFAALEDPAISRMAFTGFFAPELFSPVYLDERNQENMAKQRAIFGAEESRSMVAGFTVDGTPYLFCCDVARFGDVWYLSSLGGNIAQLMGLEIKTGGIVPLDAL